MKFNRIVFLSLTIVSLLSCSKIEAKQTIKIIPQEGDMTLVVRAALEKAKDQELTIEFSKGEYHFHSDYATGKFCSITNHDNGYKNISFLIEDFQSVDIQGNGAAFIFHGPILPFRFERCGEITISNLSIDWDTPFLFQGELMAINQDEGWYDIKPSVDGFSWKYRKGQINFPNIDGFTYSSLGSTLAFDKEHKRVIHGAIDKNSITENIEKLSNGNLRFHDTFKCDIPTGSIISSKGNKGENRYAPAIQIMASSDVHIDNVVIHHALGMGFLFEKTTDITMTNSGVYLTKDTERVVSSTADATHFSNCKGDILIENCRFENMLDDGTNVHGTYVEIDKIIDERSAIVEFKHFQQLGFDFAEAGDEVWFIHQPNPQRGAVNKIAQAKPLNARYIQLTFENALPEGIKAGDIIENKTWNPTFTMRGCTIQNHRARNVVLKTPKKVVIEDNYFSSMMAAILFRGETFFWFESGGVEDVLIRDNTFDYCAYSGNDQAVLYITPRLGKQFDKKQLYDRNIRFVDNKIKNFSNRIVMADRVDGLTISGNDIIQTSYPDQPLINPEASLFTLTNCKDVNISKNTYKGTFTKAISADANTTTTLKVEDNKGFSVLLEKN